jgi:predicted regulator of Ras-like GTPase activity (Roadblock/LC7/MglB family)
MASVAQSLANLVKVEGGIAAALVDSNSGMMLGGAGTRMDVELAAAGNTEVLRAMVKTLKNLELDDVVEDILITLGTQYHILRPVQAKPGIFLCMVLDRSKANLALARRAAQEAEETIDF